MLYRNCLFFLLCLECLHICFVQSWKKAYTGVNFDSLKGLMNCKNELDSFAQLIEFNITLVPNSSASNSNKLLRRLAINFYEDFYKNVSASCSNPFFYKQTVKYHTLASLSDLNSLNSNENYSMQVSFEGKFNLTLMPQHDYVLELFIQSPYDSHCFHIGTYIINKEIKLTTYEPHYKTMFSLENPYLLEYYDYQIITTNSIKSQVIFNSKFAWSSFSYVLTDASKAI
jgi:hypothetical protein